jgi:hypothetical protein
MTCTSLGMSSATCVLLVSDVLTRLTGQVIRSMTVAGFRAVSPSRSVSLANL